MLTWIGQPPDFGSITTWPLAWGTGFAHTTLQLGIEQLTGAWDGYLAWAMTWAPLTEGDQPRILDARASAIHGRAMISRQGSTTTDAKRAARRGKYGHWRWLTIDSGCTFHLHNNVSDLVKVKHCSDRIAGLENHSIQCTWIGDMPVALRDKGGSWHLITIRNVRIADDQPDSLLSVDQLWNDLRMDSIFRNENVLALSGHDKYHHSITTTFPFSKQGGLFQIKAQTCSSNEQGIERNTERCYVGADGTNRTTRSQANAAGV